MTNKTKILNLMLVLMVAVGITLLNFEYLVESNLSSLISAEDTTLDFTNFQFINYDDYAGGDYLSAGGTLTDDYQGEESTWTQIATNVWKDERTGVSWGPIYDWITNDFDIATCDYYTSTPRSSYDGSDTDCGEAINYCATLELAGTSNWYLPSQKEGIMAYVDGMYNQAGVTEEEAANFASRYAWTSTQSSINTGYAWAMAHVSFPQTYESEKAVADAQVRCVSRDLPIATPTPTPTPAASSTTTTTSTPASCSSTAPSSAPTIASTSRSGADITLLINLVPGTTKYLVDYGYIQGTDVYSTSFDETRSSGTYEYTIHYTDPAATYNFRVRPVNECVQGPVSPYATVLGATTSFFSSLPSPSPTINPPSSPITNVSPESIGEAADEIVNEIGNLVGQVQISPQVKDIAVKSVVATSAVAGTYTAGAAIASGITVSSALIPIYAETSRSLLHFPLDLLRGTLQKMGYFFVVGSSKLFGRKQKKKTKKSGESFVSTNLDPLGGVFVIFYSKSGNLKTAVTDLYGNYEVQLRPDDYQLRAQKPGYNFPSEVITQGSDDNHPFIYQPGTFIKIEKELEVVSHVSLALDPTNKN